MKIGIDISQLNYEGTGVANFTYNLVKNLLLTDKNNEYRLFYASLHKLNLPALTEFKKLGAKIYRFPIPHKLLHFLWGKNNFLPIDLLTGRVDVFLFSDYLRPPTFYKTRGITVVHDLIWKIFPEKHDKKTVNFHELKIEKTIKNSDTVITDSECTKNDLLKYYSQINKDKVHVIYPGIASFPIPLIPNRLIPNPFLLYVGAIEPRKNLGLAIEVFSELIKDPKYSDYKFVVAGKAGWKNKDVLKSDKVEFIGYVADEDLPRLYSEAKLTVYLSSYEGFGLPPLESLACGTPVIAGDNSSLKETLDKKFLVDVGNKDKVLEKMKYLLSNKVDPGSKEIKNRFSWKTYAKLFDKVVRGGI